jgi:hypothetical protein
MGATAFHIAGADVPVKNKTGNNYVDAVQISAVPAKLHKLTLSPLSGMAVDVYAWIYDLAAGTTASADPDIVRLIPAGLADTWDFGPDGSPFLNGIYVVLSTVRPTDATTTPAATLAGNNKVLIKADIRKK